MPKVPQPPLDWIPSPNYSTGRQGNAIKNITFHHIVGSALSAVNKFKISSSQTSAHFIVASDKIYCMVDTDDTAWTNGNWLSNLVSVTIEHEGDWRNGYRNEGVIKWSVILNAWLRDLYPNATPNRHRDVASTACPSDFPVEEVWQKAGALRDTYYQPVVVTPEWLANRQPYNSNIVKYIAKDGVVLYDLVTLKAADGRVWALNQVIENIAGYTTVSGKRYEITKYSMDNNRGAGYLSSDLLDTPYSPPVPPTPDPPLPVDPDAGKENERKLNWIIATLNAIINFFKGLIPFK